MRYLWKLLVQEIIPKRGKCRPKSVDSILSERLRDSNKANVNTIIDMTNLTRKSRVGKLNVFSKDFLKVAVIFKTYQMMNLIEEMKIEE
jgi:hypothetical protein